MSQVITDTIRFVVPGKQATAGSKRGYVYKRRDGTSGVSIVDACARAKGYSAMVRAAAMEAYTGGVTKGPISLYVVFYIRRPKSHYRKGKYSKLLRDDIPDFPTSRPDSLKMCRLIEDALSGVIYADDSQVVRHVIRKAYSTDYLTAIHVTEMI